MKYAPRTRKVQRADGEIREAIQRVEVEYDLTFAELIDILARFISAESRYELRAEREPAEKEPRKTHTNDR